MSAYDLASELYSMAKAGVDGTKRPDSKPLPQDGFFVGGKFPSLVFDDVNEIDRGELAWWIGTHDSEYYGVWVDVETGKAYFDAVDHVWYISTALRTAEIRKEIAVWDIAEGAEIRVINEA